MMYGSAQRLDSGKVTAKKLLVLITSIVRSLATMDSKSLLNTSLQCSLASVLLSIVALISASHHASTIEDLPWGVVHYKDGTNRATYNFGANRLYYTYGSTTDYTTTALYKYDSAECTASYCAPCNKALERSYGLLIGFFILTLFASGANITRKFYANSWITKSVCLVITVITLTLGFASIGEFVRNCFHKVKDDFGHYTSAHKVISFSPGPALDVLIVAVSLMFFELLVNAYVCVDSVASPLSYKQPAEQKQVTSGEQV